MVDARVTVKMLEVGWWWWVGVIKEFFFERPYQAFYDLEHYNLSKTGSFFIRKLNQPTGCLMMQSKSQNTLKPHLIAISSKK